MSILASEPAVLSERIKMFGRKLRRRRIARNMTLEALGRVSGLGPNYIGQVEIRGGHSGAASRLTWPFASHTGAARSCRSSLALRSDGKVLIAVSHVEGADIAGRDRWEGIVLSILETAEVFRAMSDAADDAAGHTARRIRWREKKRHPPGDGWQPPCSRFYK